MSYIRQLTCQHEKSACADHEIVLVPPSFQDLPEEIQPGVVLLQVGDSANLHRASYKTVLKMIKEGVRVANFRSFDMVVGILPPGASPLATAHPAAILALGESSRVGPQLRCQLSNAHVVI
jgi:hypothetical protein